MNSFIIFIFGLIILFYGAELLIDNGRSIAAKFGISSLIIGITVVAFGTSLPELIVSLTANFKGSGGIALGNIIGSNIANIGLVIGLISMINPIKCNYHIVKLDLVVLVVISTLFFIICYIGDILKIHGILFITLLFIYLISIIKRKNIDNEQIIISESYFKLILLSIIGIFMLYLGTNYFIKGAVGIAELFDLTDTAVGLTIVAIGTSAPELATSILAIKKKDSDIILGNIIGSNLFNILAVIGITALFKDLIVELNEIKLSIIICSLFTITLPIILYFHNKINRICGLIYFIIYFWLLISIYTTV